MSHSLDELGAFKNVMIVSWKILKENLSGAIVVFDVNGTLVNKTLGIPFVYKTVKSYEWITIDGMRFKHGIITPIGYIDRALIMLGKPKDLNHSKFKSLS